MGGGNVSSISYSPYETVFGKSLNIEKEINFSSKELTNKQLNKLVKQSEFGLENDIVTKNNIFAGDKVMIKILPK